MPMSWRSSPTPQHSCAWPPPWSSKPTTSGRSPAATSPMSPWTNYAPSSPTNTPLQHLPNNTKSPSVQHDSLMCEPRQIRSPPIHGTLSPTHAVAFPNPFPTQQSRGAIASDGPRLTITLPGLGCQRFARVAGSHRLKFATITRCCPAYGFAPSAIVPDCDRQRAASSACSFGRASTGGLGAAGRPPRDDPPTVHDVGDDCARRRSS